MRPSPRTASPRVAAIADGSPAVLRSPAPLTFCKNLSALTLGVKMKRVYVSTAVLCRSSRCNSSNFITLSTRPPQAQGALPRFARSGLAPLNRYRAHFTPHTFPFIRTIQTRPTIRRAKNAVISQFPARYANKIHDTTPPFAHTGYIQYAKHKQSIQHPCPPPAA